MTKFCGCHNFLGLLLAALVSASTIINSECRAVVVEDQNLQLKSVLELSSRDEIVRMAGYGEAKLSTVLITGMVVCNEACLSSSQGNNQFSIQPISGALVGAICQTNSGEKRQDSATTVTDEYGEFIIDLPSQLHAIHDLDKVCSVKVLELPKNSPCQQSSFNKKPKEISLSSVGNGIRTYTAETLHMVPKDTEACIKVVEEDEQQILW